MTALTPEALDTIEALPQGSMIRSNLTGMVLVRLRYLWVNLNDSVQRYPYELAPDEWTITHVPIERSELRRLRTENERQSETLHRQDRFADSLQIERDALRSELAELRGPNAADRFYDALLDELHGANLISTRVPDDGPDEEWVDESASADLLMLAERAFRAALTGEGAE